jgi:ribosomal 50S subunit-associated protein YjgA (DUF615 family)
MALVDSKVNPNLIRRRSVKLLGDIVRNAAVIVIVRRLDQTERAHGELLGQSLVLRVSGIVGSA